MPKRKSTYMDSGRERFIYNKDEMMTETVHLCIQYNLYKGLSSNDLNAINYAKNLNVEQLREFNLKLKNILSLSK